MLTRAPFLISNAMSWQNYVNFLFILIHISLETGIKSFSFRSLHFAGWLLLSLLMWFNENHLGTMEKSLLTICEYFSTSSIYSEQKKYITNWFKMARDALTLQCIHVFLHSFILMSYWKLRFSNLVLFFGSFSNIYMHWALYYRMYRLNEANIQCLQW